MTHRGVVTRVTAAGVFVRIPATWPGVEWGPLQRVETVAPLTAGQQVLVVFVAVDDPVVVGRLL